MGEAITPPEAQIETYGPLAPGDAGLDRDAGRPREQALTTEANPAHECAPGGRGTPARACSCTAPRCGHCSRSAENNIDHADKSAEHCTHSDRPARLNASHVNSLAFDR